MARQSLLGRTGRSFYGDLTIFFIICPYPKRANAGTPRAVIPSYNRGDKCLGCYFKFLLSKVSQDYLLITISFQE